MSKKTNRKWMWSLAMALSLGIAGCNLFHPTDRRDAESDDPDAVIIKYYDNGTLKTVKANLRDTHPVEMYDYYSENPNAVWDD